MARSKAISICCILEKAISLRKGARMPALF